MTVPLDDSGRITVTYAGRPTREAASSWVADRCRRADWAEARRDLASITFERYIAGDGSPTRPRRAREHRARRRSAGARRAARSGDSGDDGPPGESSAATAVVALVALLALPFLAVSDGRLKKPSQSQRVLEALLRAGERGIVTLDFLAPTIDGREPILRLPSRIDELRQAGHDIETVQKRPVARYVLRRDAEASHVDEAEQPSLLEPPTGPSRPASPYDTTGDWA